MKSNVVKLIVNILVLVLFIGGVTYLALNTVEISDYTIRSLADYEVGIEDIKKAEETYTQAVSKETRTKADLSSKVQNFETEKEKYNNISEETIKIIQDATKIERYSIEYLWVRLGNYATKYNVSITVTEPGNTSGTSDETQTNPGTNGGDTLPGGNMPGGDIPGGSMPGENTPGLDFGMGSDTDIDTDTSTESGGVLTVQIAGTYKNICDFIYVVENDATLRFKLENIDISGSENVTANFEIKNMQIVL